MIRPMLAAGAVALVASGTPAHAGVLLPGSFLTEDILGSGISIDDPEGLAVIGDVLYVVDDGDSVDWQSTLTSINLNTGSVTQSSLALGSAFTSVGTGTLTGGSVSTFSLTSGAGGLTFGAGDEFFLALDNTSGSGAPNTTMGSFGAGGPLVGPPLGVSRWSFVFGDGLGAELLGTVNADGTINIAVSGFPDFNFDGLDDFSGDPHDQEGDFELFLSVGPGVRLNDVEGLTAFNDPVEGDTLFLGGENTVLVQIDPETLEVFNNFDLATTTAGAIDADIDIAGLASDGTNLYVSAGENLWVIDPTDGSLIDQMTFLGLDIEGLGFDGVNLILGNDASPESVIFVDPNDLSVVATADTFPSVPGGGIFDPTGVAYSPTLGRIILSDPDLNNLPNFHSGAIGTVPVAVPAPLALLGAGLVALGWTRRRRVG